MQASADTDTKRCILALASGASFHTLDLTISELKAMTTTTSPSRSLIGLAVLKVDWDLRQRDFVEAFVPMVVECIRVSDSDAISLGAVQRDITARFGLTLPLNALRTVLHRAARHGYVQVHHGVYRRDVTKCATLSFADTEARVVATHDSVVGSLIRFAEQKHGTVWDQATAEAGLLSFLSASDWQLLLVSSLGETVLPASRVSDAQRYIVATFVQHARNNDAPLFESLETLAKGHLLANVMYVPDLGRVSQRFANTRVYFDTAFLLYALGYAGQDRQAPCSELLALLHESGADLACFEDTREELGRILDACGHRIRHNDLATAYGPAIEHFLARGLSPSDIALMSANLTDTLAFHRIKVEDKPEYLHHYVIDEAALQGHLEKAIHYQNPQACVHDVDCLSSIMRLRRGHTYSAVENCKAIFVTTNATLAQAGRAFFHDRLSASAIPPCITDYWLGNLLWLKSPTRAPDLPMKRIIADAYASMDPPPALWKSYLAEITRLREGGRITDDQYFVLRHSAAARAAVMDLTKGQVHAFTEGTVAEVLAVAEVQIRADTQRQLDEEIEHRLHLESSVAATEVALLEESERRRVEREELSARIVSLEEHKRVVYERATLRARRWAHGLMLLPRIGVVALFLVGLALTFPWTLPSPTDARWRYAASALLVVMFVVTAMGSYWGTPLAAYVQRGEDRLAAYLRDRLLLGE